MARHPCGWIIRVCGMDKNRRATQAAGIFIKVARQVGPGEFGHKQIVARPTGGHRDDCLRARPKSKSQSAITFAFGSAESNRPAGRPPRQLDVYCATLRGSRMNLDPDPFLHHFFVSSEPPIFHAEDRHVRFDFLSEPALELQLDSAQTPKVVLLA